MTKILYERSGGFAGLHFAATFDLDSLPDEEARLLQDLLDRADFFNLPANTVKRPVPDEFSYTITVETTERQHTVLTSDTSAPDELQPLLNELGQRARLQRRR